MSQTLAHNPIAAAISSSLAVASDFFMKDIQATPDEVFCNDCGGSSRSPLAFTTEVAGFNFLIAKVLAGGSGERMTDEERKAFYDANDSKGKIMQTYAQSVEAVQTAIAQVPMEDWSTEVMAPWGVPATKQAMAGFVGLHTMYHDGQLNYVQTLKGDMEVHWM